MPETRSQKYSRLHRQQIRDKANEYRRTHLKQSRAKGRKYYYLHREQVREQVRKSSMKPAYRFRVLKRSAEVRGIKVHISFDEYLKIVADPCRYCGGCLPKSGSGVDRIDNKIGYVSGNLCPCCSACNIAKRAMTESEFRCWVLQVSNHWANK